VTNEENSIKKIDDSINLFEKLSESSRLEKNPFFLLLNKIDLFEENINYIPLENIYDDFNDIIKENGKEDLSIRDQSLFYIQNMFTTRYKGKGGLYTIEINTTEDESFLNALTIIKNSIAKIFNY